MNNVFITKQQREAIALLSIGTFLEYFDLMLYVHLSVLLNNLFFPQTNPTTAKLLGATAFCMTFALRPVGGFVIGKIGDAFGRKTTITITTFIMAFSCLMMACIPTYNEIGIIATILVMVCRMLQGFSSLGEIMGVLTYFIETLRSPNRYIASGFVHAMSKTGGMVALACTSLVISSEFSWRIIFFAGAVIAIIGVVARTRLRETPEFVNYKSRMRIKEQKSQHFKNSDHIVRKTPYTKNDKIAICGIMLSTIISSISFYITYIYVADFKKEVLGISFNTITYTNLIISLCGIAAICFFTFLCKKYHPVKILKFNITIQIIAILIFPSILNHVAAVKGDLRYLFLVQLLLYLFINPFFTEALWFRHFPIDRRFTVSATAFGVSTAIGYAISSYGLIPLVRYFGYHGIWFLALPFMIGFRFSISYLKKLEIDKGAYYDYPDEHPKHEDTGSEVDEYDYDDLGDEYDPFKGSSVYSSQFINKINSLNKISHKKVNIKLIKKAVIFARKWHDGQLRKHDNAPYYSHSLEVASMTAQYLFKTDVLVAAILHDVVEDSDCSIQTIEKHFNFRIAQIVDILTKMRFEDNKYIKLTLEQTVNKILHDAKDYEALFIKQMDRMHNLQTISCFNHDKQLKISRETDILTRLMAIVCDKLNIHEKIHLENLIFKSSLLKPH